MNINFDEAKHAQAIDIIAAKISKLPADKRSQEAKSMANWFIDNVDCISVNMREALTPGTPENAKLHAINAEKQRIADAAVAKANSK